MVVKIEVIQIKERYFTETFSLRIDKVDLKGLQTNFETLFLQVSVTIWHLSIRERVRKKMRMYTFEKQRN